MSRYIQILSLQRPFPFNLDDNQRMMFSCNFEAMAEGPVDKWEEELAQSLISQSIATALGTDVFIGVAATIPTGDGPYIQINDTGGRDTIEEHAGTIYEQLSCQVIVRAKNYTTARTKALAVWRELDGKRNTTITAP